MSHGLHTRTHYQKYDFFKYVYQFSPYAVDAHKASDSEVLRVTADLRWPLSLHKDSPLLSPQDESTASKDCRDYIRQSRQARAGDFEFYHTIH
jgi:hypothetical protein